MKALLIAILLVAGCAARVESTECAQKTSTHCYQTGDITRCDDVDGSYWDYSAAGHVTHWSYTDRATMAITVTCEQ